MAMTTRQRARMSKTIQIAIFIIAQIIGMLIYFAYGGRAAEKARANG